jgi:alginate O-acetyltransferase complex protein AlgI
MLFNSLQFLLFFMVVSLAYYRLPNQKLRVWLLLIASCYFYMTFIPKYLLILGGTILVDYFAGLLIARSSGKTRKAWLVLSIITNVGVLLLYKYYFFLLDTIAPVLRDLFPHYDIPYMNFILPIGLSFHTFQAMSYTIEVYRGNQPPERNFVVYALYVMFYPQLVAGPIERPQHILPQLHEFKPYNWDNVKEGLARMLWGFFKKVVIADRLAIEVNHAYSHTGLSAWALWVGAIFYSFQIYCDFSGYSDIALGSAKVMGINLMENFKQPYISSGITEFWGRWHISLSSWFRDYVYIPMGGNRRGETRRKINVLTTFMLSGLWHGANFTFIVWGALHGLLVTFMPGRKTIRHKWVKTIFLVLVNFILVTLLWVFFRSPNMQFAFNYIKGMFTPLQGIMSFGLHTSELLFSVALIAS